MANYFVDFFPDNKAPTFKLNFGEGETTAVANSQLSTLNSTLSEWYDMQGRKVSGKPTKKGMYIHKGSKVVIK